MRHSLLEITQEILSDMDSDEVNSIFDTVESEQVAQIVKSTYFAMMSTREWPHMRKAIQINPSADDAFPTHMYVQDDIVRLVFINYNCVKENSSRRYYQPMRWKEPDEFLKLTNAQNTDDEHVDVVVDNTGVELLIRNDRNPTYYTSFDDKALVFNSYDKAIEDTLQNSKVQALAYVMPEWTHQDSFIPDLPTEAFMALVEESKSKAMFKLKQMQDVKAEQEAGRQQRWLSRNAWRINGGIRYPNYGRKGHKPGRDTTFKQGR